MTNDFHGTAYLFTSNLTPSVMGNNEYYGNILSIFVMPLFFFIVFM